MFFYLGFFYDNGLITDFGDDGGVADGRVKSAGFFWGYLFFLLIYFGQFWFFLTRFVFTITDFGDDGS